MKSDKFLKIASLKKLMKYGLPIPETLFVFNFEKQEKEIDEFLKGKKFISVRSDKEGDSRFCPNFPKCQKSKAKPIIRKIINKGYAVILHEYLPTYKRRIAAGHILTLRNHILMELVGSGPVSRVDREGEIEEYLVIRKADLTETQHFGRRLINKRVLKNIVRLVGIIPPFKVLDFALIKRGPYFYQIQDDKTSKTIDIS